MELRWPHLSMIDSYVAALQRGWYANTMSPASGPAELAAIAHDAAGFVRSQVDLTADGTTIELPDGSIAQRIPGYRKWIWDGEFCGSISFRWVPGSVELPPHVLGHVGYSVAEWKQGRGLATRALRLILHDAAQQGLVRLEVTTDVDNIASHRVIERNGGEIVEQFDYPAEYDTERTSGLRWHVPTSNHSS